MSARTMQILADLAARRALDGLGRLCDEQKQVSTGRLYAYVTQAGDTLAGYAFELRREHDALAQRCRELQEDRQRTADELVAFVHGEHSAVCAERDNLKAAFTEWLDKTAWVQQEISAGKLPAHYLGQHRADIMSAEIERLRGEVERYKSQVVEEAGKVLNLAGENARLRASIPQPDWKLCTACREMHPRDRFDKAHPDFPTRDGLNLICREAADKRGYRLHRRPDGKVEEAKD